MAKPAVTRDRYRIHAETSIEQMGFVLAAFTKMGLDNIGYELITDVATYKERAPRIPNSPGGKAADFIREYMTKHPAFLAKDLVKHFKDDGRTDGAAYAALTMMTKAGELKRIGAGQYQSSDIKVLPASKKVKEVAPDVGPHDATNKDVILRYLRGRTQVSAAALNEYFKQDGRNPRSVGALLTMLGHQKILRNKGSGIWDVTAKGIKASTAAHAVMKASPAELAPIEHEERADG